MRDCPYPNLRLCDIWRRESSPSGARSTGPRNSSPSGRRFSGAIWRTLSAEPAIPPFGRSSRWRTALGYRCARYLKTERTVGVRPPNQGRHQSWDRESSGRACPGRRSIFSSLGDFGCLTIRRVAPGLAAGSPSLLSGRFRARSPSQTASSTAAGWYDWSDNEAVGFEGAAARSPGLNSKCIPSVCAR